MALASLSRLPEASREQMGAALNVSLAALLALYADLKLAHWNSKGPNFIALHKFFDKLSDEVLDRADTIAERIIGLGVPALGAVRTVAGSSVASYPEQFDDALDHVRKLLTVYTLAHDALRQARNVAIKVDDRESTKILDDLSTDLEHDVALLRPHVETPPAAATPKLPK